MRACVVCVYVIYTCFEKFVDFVSILFFSFILFLFFFFLIEDQTHYFLNFCYRSSLKIFCSKKKVLRLSSNKRINELHHREFVFLNLKKKKKKKEM